MKLICVRNDLNHFRAAPQTPTQCDAKASSSERKLPTKSKNSYETYSTYLVMFPYSDLSIIMPNHTGLALFTI